jgi:hypothetical protein
LRHSPFDEVPQKVDLAEDVDPEDLVISVKKVQKLGRQTRVKI